MEISVVHVFLYKTCVMEKRWCTSDVLHNARDTNTYIEREREEWRQRERERDEGMSKREREELRQINRERER